MDNHKLTRDEEYRYAKEALQWYGWGSPVGLGLGIALVLSSLGLMLWLLNMADVI